LIWGANSRRLGVDLEAVQNEISSQKAKRPNDVANWFHDTYHLTTVPPPGFDYDWLVFYDLAYFQGRRVPLLFFARGEANARVYILSADQFDFHRLVEQPGYNIAFCRHPDDPRVAYVISYSSENLQWFQKRDAEPEPRVGQIFQPVADAE
jgi:hypothetical protein